METTTPLTLSPATVAAVAAAKAHAERVLESAGDTEAAALTRGLALLAERSGEWTRVEVAHLGGLFVCRWERSA